jgi:predicted HicB family RNase H-like nuclease
MLRTRLKLKKAKPKLQAKLKPPKPPTVVASIRLQPKLKQQIQEIAERRQRTFNSLVIRLLTSFAKREGRNDWKGE